jgi:hypothetical protein
MTPQDPLQPQGQPIPPQNQAIPPQSRPVTGQPGPTSRPAQVRPEYQWQPAKPAASAGNIAGTKGTTGTGAGTATKAKSGQSLESLLAAFKPEPAKAPPLEWVGLGVSVVLLICGFLPWINLGTGGSLSGLEIGDGWLVIGAGLVAAVLGFVGLSRDSISLAAGQALVGLIALGFALVNLLNPGPGDSAAFGVILTLIISLIVIGLGVYNAFDARRKGAKY